MKRKIYLDYAATTPLDLRSLKEMLPYLKENFANTASPHLLGQEAKKKLEECRQKIAQIISAKPNEIIFTSSATESNNLAIKGIAWENKNKGNHLIISSIEHASVLESAKWLETQGFKISKLSVDKYGLVSLKEIVKKIKKETILVSVMHANNEVGTIQPIEEIGKICKRKKIYFHTDAAQTLGKIPINVKKLNVDLLTASSHKIYGPKGAALLYIKEGVKMTPLLHGGKQELGIRSSTVNLAAIVGFTKALEISQKEMSKENERIEELRKIFEKGLLKKIKKVRILGHPKQRLPHIINLNFENMEGFYLMLNLEEKGIFCSTVSACASEKLEPSHVLLAMGLNPKNAHNSIRLSLGRWTEKKDILSLLEILPKIIQNLRNN